MKEKRCGNVIECNLPIDLNEHHINLNNRTFCCTDCVLEFIKQENRLEYTAENGQREDYIPLNYNAPKAYDL